MRSKQVVVILTAIALLELEYDENDSNEKEAKELLQEDIQSNPIEFLEDTTAVGDLNVSIFDIKGAKKVTL